MAKSTDQAIYSIGAVSRMLDIPTSTLRAWEERYALIAPVRSGGAQRLYSAAQVEQLRFVKAQIDAGVSAADAHRLLANNAGAGRPADSPAPARGRRAMVLIAERDAFVADLADDYLRSEGFDVAIALDAAQARQMFEERAPDVVVADLLLSAGAGYRLVEEIAASGTSEVVALSAIDSSDDAIRAGASRFVRKPVDLPRLVATIRDLLGTTATARGAHRHSATT